MATILWPVVPYTRGCTSAYWSRHAFNIVKKSPYMGMGKQVTVIHYAGFMSSILYYSTQVHALSGVSCQSVCLSTRWISQTGWV